MTSESPHDDRTVTAGLPEQRTAQPSEAAEAALPRQSDGGSDSAAVPGAPAESAAAEAEQPESGGLSERDRAVLAFEKQHFKYSGSKEQAIRDRFGMSATRYYQVLNALLDRPEALEFDPVVVNRLRRRRAVRQRARSSHPEA